MSFPARLLLSLLLIGGPLQAQDSEPVPVNIKTLADLIQHPEYSVPATAISLNNSRISARITAEIDSMPVLVGDRVETGQVLVNLDCTDSQLNFELTRANLSLAEKELSRTRSLAKTSNASAQQLNLRSTEYTQAKVARNQAELEVKRCIVSAPFTGIVTARLAAEGELATPGTPLLQLLDAERLEISAQIPLNLVSALQVTRRFEFHTEQQHWPATLRSLLPVVNTNARNQEARLLFAAEKALPGSAGRIIWQSDQAHVAPDLLVQRSDSVGIFVLDGTTARFVSLPDARIGHPAPINLSADTQVILEGRFALSDGDKVAVTP